MFYHTPLSQTLEHRDLAIVQFREGNTFGIAIELLVFLLVLSHWTKLTLSAGQAKPGIEDGAKERKSDVRARPNPVPELLDRDFEGMPPAGILQIVERLRCFGN